MLNRPAVLDLVLSSGQQTAVFAVHCHALLPYKHHVAMICVSDRVPF